MSTIHFLNVLEGDCNIIQHDSQRISVIDVSNADNKKDSGDEFRKKISSERRAMFQRTQVPFNKIDYKQKESPDNPIDYIKNKLRTNSIFRFIITHPDCDHIDGIKDLYDEFEVINTWDTDNTKQIDLSSSFGGYSKDDWKFYTTIRDGSSGVNRRAYLAGNEQSFFVEDDLKILCPSHALVQKANSTLGDYHDASYVLLFTPPKRNGKSWKIIFAGDSSNESWDYILNNFRTDVSNIDILFAPHHGRGSGRNFDFLKTLNPKVTLLGNASSEHLAYNCYPQTRITNNQAGYVVMDISLDNINFYVKNYEFAENFCKKRDTKTSYNSLLDAWAIGYLN